MDIYHLLNDLNIVFKEVEHKAVYTSQEAEFIKTLIDGVGIKNLFLKNKKQEYFLVLIEDNKTVKIKEIEKELNTGHLTFASEEELQDKLNLKRGSVTPLGLINDKNHEVKVVIDASLKEQIVLVHPNINTKTMSIKMNNLINLIEFLGNDYYFIPM